MPFHNASTEEKLNMERALPIGTIVQSPANSYVIEAFLGSGGFGITYKVRRISDGVIFAIKEYFPSQMCERNGDYSISFLKVNEKRIAIGLNDFITEAARLNKNNISHPNIVAICEVFKANNTAYYVMEYISGVNLLQYIVDKHGNKPLDVEQTLSIMQPIIGAVNFLHKHKLTHLDIKHENIVLTNEADGVFRPVLIDFGQSKHYDKRGNATSQLTNAGFSNGFSPVEQYLGLSKFTPQADVYSLCATILFLLTAERPPKSSDITPQRIIEMLGNNVSAYIKDALVRGMRFNLSERTPSVECLAADLGISLTNTQIESNVTLLLDAHSIVRHKFKLLIKPSLVIIASMILSIITYVLIKNQYTTSNSDRLTMAINQKDEKELKIFAEYDSARAFLPYAKVLFDNKNYSEAQRYALKALEAIGDSTARKLLLSINDEIRISSYNDVMEKAIKANDINSLLSVAKEGYSPAYYPLAYMYYQGHDDKSAKYWAQKSIDAGQRLSESSALIENINRINSTPTSNNSPKKPISNIKQSSSKTLPKANVKSSKNFKKSEDLQSELPSHKEKTEKEKLIEHMFN